jgi:hypothetical protein
MDKQVNKLSILIVGYDGYIDVWNNFFTLLKKNWPNTQYKFYLVNNFLNPKYDNVEIIKTNKNYEFTKKVQYALDYINSDYVLLLLEDFFIGSKIEDSSLNFLVEKVIQYNSDYLKLLNQNQSIKGFRMIEKNFYKINKKKEYSISLQPSIWNKDFLFSIIKKKDLNPWQFEIFLNRCNSFSHESIYYVNNNPLKLIHTIVQGKYLPITKRKFHSDIIYKRPIMSRIEYLLYKLKQILSFFFSKNVRKHLRKFASFVGINLISNRIK